MKGIREAAALAVVLLSGLVSPAQAGVVENWNILSVACVTRPGPTGLLDLALVHAAIHDAVQSVENRYQPYRVKASPAGGETLDGIVAGAAWGVLADTRICPAGAARTNALAAYTTAAGSDAAGTALGFSVGQQMLADYRAVPVPAPVYTPVPGPGEWQPTPFSFAPMSFVYLATTEPFVLLRPSQFRSPPPPPMTSQRYAREYEEVYLRGGVNSHPASVDCASGDPAQATADVAKFWSGNFVVNWSQASRDISLSRGLSTGDAARLLALVYLAAADSAIAVWDSKLHFHFWRPETAILASGDTEWVPFIRGPNGHFPATSQTPSYPEYVSGANGLTGAVTGMLRLALGTDEVSFAVYRAVPAAVTICTNPRTYTRLSDAAEEVVDARILLGIHFRSGDVEARRLGERVAHWIFHKSLQPVPPGRQ
jgi:hypothetical protein